MKIKDGYIYLPQDTFYNLQQYEVRTQAVWRKNSQNTKNNTKNNNRIAFDVGSLLS